MGDLTTGSVALHLSGYNQFNYHFYKLSTEKVLNQINWKYLIMTNNTKDRIKLI